VKGMVLSLKKNKFINAQHRFIWLCLIPPLILISFFFFIPIIISFVGSFSDWNALTGEFNFGTLMHYKKMVTDDIAWRSVWNTLYLTSVAVGVKTLIALILAIMVTRMKIGETFYRSVFFFPTVCSMVATVFIFRFIFQPDKGVVNQVLLLFFDTVPGWTEDPKWAMPAVILYHLWKDMGYVFIIFLAGLQGIPKDIIEASVMDGAINWKRTLYIELPLVKTVTIFNIATQTIGSLQIFTSIMIFTSDARAANMGGPFYATTTTGLYIYRKAFEEYNFGYASALAILLFAIIMVITLFQIRAMKTDWSY